MTNDWPPRKCTVWSNPEETYCLCAFCQAHRTKRGQNPASWGAISLRGDREDFALDLMEQTLLVGCSLYCDNVGTFWLVPDEKDDPCDWHPAHFGLSWDNDEHNPRGWARVVARIAQALRPGAY